MAIAADFPAVSACCAAKAEGFNVANKNSKLTRSGITVMPVGGKTLAAHFFGADRTLSRSERTKLISPGVPSAMFLYRMQPPQRSRHGCENSMAVHAWLPLTLVKFLPVILINAGIVSSIFSMPAHAPAPQRSKMTQSTQAAIPDFEQAKEFFHRVSLDDTLAAVQRALARSPPNCDGVDLLPMI